MAKTVYALWCRDSQNFVMSGDKVLIFPQSSDASNHQTSSSSLREDVIPRPHTNVKTYDVITLSM